MNCQNCSLWETGIPAGRCKHPKGKNDLTTNRMVFDYVDEYDCPLQNKMKSLLENIKRVDFESSIGSFVIPKTLIFDKRVISEVEVLELVNSCKCENDNRVIVTSPEQFENIFNYTIGGK